MSAQQQGQVAGAVCDGCGTEDTAETPLVEVVRIVDRVPEHIWYCSGCLEERSGDCKEVQR